MSFSPVRTLTASLAFAVVSSSALAATSATSATSATVAASATSATPETPPIPTAAAAARGTTAAAAATGYAVRSRFAAGGEGGWDYLTVDASGHRLFVSRSSHVQVLDLATGSPVGDIPDTAGVHGIALVPALQRGFTSNGRAGTVTVFDLATLKPIETVKTTGGIPDFILYEPATKRILTFNGRGANVTAIDAGSAKVVGTLAVGGKPEAAVADGTGRVFVNVEDRAEVVAFDARTMKEERRWSLAPCEEPTGLALDAARGRLFSGCGNRMLAVVNVADGALLATVPTGQGTDGVAFDPGTGTVFVSNGEGTLSLVREERPGSFVLVGNVPTERGARTVALDPATHRLYLPTARFGPPPAPTADRPRPRPSIVPGSFEILVVGPEKG